MQFVARRPTRYCNFLHRGTEGALIRRIPPGAWWALLSLVAAAALALVAGLLTSGRERAAIAAAAAVDARLDAALFNSEVARFRVLPRALRGDGDVAAALAGRAGAARRLDAKLEALAASTGAAVLYVVDRRGMAIAASNWRSPVSFVGNDYAFRRYVRDAQRVGEATQFARGNVSGRPGLYLSCRTADGGVIVVKQEFGRLEAAWRRATGATFVLDAAGVVLVTSRRDWRFAATRPLAGPRLEALRREASLPPGSLRPLPLPRRAELVARLPTDQPGWTLELRRPLPAAVRSVARLAAGGAALSVLLLSAILWGARQRAVTSRRRTSELEDAVAARTAELTAEMEERAASEARAADLRERLRQANRLATLGQVTASVAHETAQPLVAIRTYARTTAALVDRGETMAVHDNLHAIARLAERVGTVTAELRGFARRQPGEVRPVALTEVIEGATLILREQLARVMLTLDPVAPAIRVMGGRVRLEQILVNILQNAIDALADSPDPRIAVTHAVAPGRVVLAVTDNGPGIPPDLADRLFTPFVTSRTAGLGLGLVIAQDIAEELGGSLRLVSSPAGARFEIEMVMA